MYVSGNLLKLYFDFFNSIIQKDINNGGRGMNMVVVDTHRMKAVNARRFDTYAMDSSEMELFLLREVREGDILIAMTFDEASRNLGAMAKNILADLGRVYFLYVYM